jgi:hypothetical protein
MSIIKKKFYHLFWNNPSCQNLFLLSKVELLETRTFGTGEFTFTFSTNRIIVSNAQDSQNEFIDTIKNRSEFYNMDLDNSIAQKIEYFKPLIEQFFNSKFKNSIEKVGNDIENNTFRFFSKIFKLAIDEKNLEKNVIKLLQEYEFVGPHLKSFKEIEANVGKLLLPAKGNELINEQTIHSFFEGIKFIKEMYVNHSYKNLFNTNQVLINTLNSEDNFTSRIKLFGELYDSQIIVPSKDDAFIECSHCDPLTYRGTFQLQLNPKKLHDLKCPVCTKELTYFVPYELHNDIYEIVKSHDGLILDALCNRLSASNISFETNKKFLNDIEIDCIFRDGNKVYLIETKMYKQNTEQKNIISKIKEHYSKLIKDVERIEETGFYKESELIPILMVNITNHRILSNVLQHFANSPTHKYSETGKILNLNLLKIGDKF